MSILGFFGLVKRSKHEAIAKVNKGLLRDLTAERQKFKRAVSDIAAQSAVIDDLTPDAEKWRDRQRRERERGERRKAARA